MKKLTKKEMRQEISGMYNFEKYRAKLPHQQTELEKNDPLGKSLDIFIGEWNRQAKILNRKQSDELIAWAQV